MCNDENKYETHDESWVNHDDHDSQVSHNSSRGGTFKQKVSFFGN